MVKRSPPREGGRGGRGRGRGRGGRGRGSLQQQRRGRSSGSKNGSSERPHQRQQQQHQVQEQQQQQKEKTQRVNRKPPTFVGFRGRSDRFVEESDPQFREVVEKCYSGFRVEAPDTFDPKARKQNTFRDTDSTAVKFGA